MFSVYKASSLIINAEMSVTPKKRLRPTLPPLTMGIVSGVEDHLDQSQSPKTAPVVDEAVMDLRSAIEAKAHRPVIRTYSLSQTTRPPPQRRSEAFRPKLNRQKTLSGESSNSTSGGGFGSAIFMRTFSKNYDVTSTASSCSVEEWRRLFDRYDMEHNGKIDGRIPVNDFERIMEENVLWTEKVPPQIRAHIIASADLNGDGMITQDEFVEMAKGKHIPGFNSRRRRALRELLRQTVEFIVPYKYQYQNQYSCFPPPLFMLTLSLIQIIIFAYNSYVGGVGLNGPVFHCSRLIFDPDKRYEAWRYVTYALVHSGIFHATFNILIQLVLGLPLEMVHGWWRVSLVYLSGVLAGSLWTSVLKPSKFVAGASGGVYALITAHLGTVIMNYKEMTLAWCRVLTVVIVAVSDVAVYVYDIYLSAETSQKPVGYAAHIAGAFAGLFVGILVLRNLRWERHERYIWAFSACVFLLLIGSAIIWSLAVPSHFVGIRHQVNITCLSDHVL